MKQRLNILHVEDSEDDSVRVRRELGELECEIFYSLIDEEEKLKEALKEKRWDVVLCDYTMPSFSGLDAAMLIKKFDPELPVIFISAAMDECVVHKALEMGACSFVEKSNLVSLIPVIQNLIK